MRRLRVILKGGRTGLILLLSYFFINDRAFSYTRVSLLSGDILWYLCIITDFFLYRWFEAPHRVLGAGRNIVKRSRALL